MPRKRDNGSGSVYRRKDGQWAAALSVGGRRVVRYAGTKQEAKKLLAELVSQSHQGLLASPTTTTLGEWVERWLEVQSHRLRPSSHQTYTKVLLPLVRELGPTPLHQLTPLMITLTLTSMQKTSGKRQLQLGYTYLKSCLDEAVRMGLLLSNPLLRVKKPAWQPRQRSYWTLPETQRFIQTALASGERYAPLFVFLATTGLRISEALGLTWGDVDERGVTIHRCLVWQQDVLHELPPKTKAGYRTVSLPSLSRTALSLLPPSSTPTTPLFRTATGTAPTPTHLRDYLLRLCDKAEVPRINIHGLRHVAAMLALEASGDIYLVQRRLGHSHVGVTLQIYGYPAKDEAVVAEKLDAMLG